jgi:hypothetical protein
MMRSRKAVLSISKGTVNTAPLEVKRRCGEIELKSPSGTHGADWYTAP